MAKRKKNTRKKVQQAVQTKAVVKKSNNKAIGFGIAAILVIGLIILLSSGGSGSDYPDITTPKPVVGNEDAPVLIEEFFDLQCPACAQAHPIPGLLQSEYPDQIAVKYYHFPLTNIHPLAFQAHVAAECANDQGIMPQFIDKVYENQNAMRKNDLIAYGEELGADETFSECVNSRTKDDIINADMDEGLNRNVRGTPSFFINGDAVPLNIDQMRNKIEAELAE